MTEMSCFQPGTVSMTGSAFCSSVGNGKSSVSSPCTLYSEELVTFNESDYDQKDCQGFINLWGLPDTVQALREQGKL